MASTSKSQSPMAVCEAEPLGLGLPEAPTFRPTADEFHDPLKYIASIRHLAEPFGICKIVPPVDWKPPCLLDKEKLVFPTRIQSVHELQHRTHQAGQSAFYGEYDAFLRSQGKNLSKWKLPQYAGKDIEVFRLHKAVQKRGGYHAVTEEKKWKEITKIMQVPNPSSGNATYGLRQLYAKYLLPFDDWKGSTASGSKQAIKDEPQQGVPADASAGGSKRSAEELDPEAAEAAEILEAMGMVAQGFDREDGPEEVSPSPDPPPLKKRKTERTRQKKEKDKTPSATAGSAQPAAEEQSGLPSPGVRVPSNIDTLVCELCKGGHHEEKIILCDRCDKGFHLFCLSPPLQDVPVGDWVCPLCKQADAEAYAFKPGQEMSFQEFERMANAFKRNYWGGDSKAKKVSAEELESEFWRLVEGAEEPLEVLYGADLDSSQYGSGFPLKDKSDKAYSEHPWNINNLPRQGGPHSSLLKHLEDNIPGVIVPWLYIGMQFSSFCWHIEDHFFYSINYHHFGEPKRWYSVPASSSTMFEEVFKQTLPEQFQAQPDLLFHLVTMLSPRILRQHDVPVYTTIQEEGNFIITFPGAYHAGYNHGLNCAEAVNFAPADWLRYAQASAERYRHFRKPPVISQEDLLIKVARQDPSPETAVWVYQELQRVVKEERALMMQAWQQGVRGSRRIPTPVGIKPEDTEDHECATCRSLLHTTALECDCCPGRYVCLHHTDTLCECKPYKHRLLYRYSLAELSQVLEQVQAKAAACTGEAPSDVTIDQEQQAATVQSATVAAIADGSTAVAEQQAAEAAVLNVVQGTAAGTAEAATSTDLPTQRTQAVATAAAAAAATAVTASATAAARQETDRRVTQAERKMAEASHLWLERAKTLLSHGNGRLTDLDILIQEAEQYLWAGDDMQPIRDMEKTLRSAKQWASDMAACSKTSKPNLATLQELLKWEPPPVSITGLSKLRDAASAGAQWLERYTEVVMSNDKTPLDAAALANLVHQGTQLPVQVAELADAQDRLAGCKEASALAQNLLDPGADEKPALSELKALQVRLSQAKLIIPEQAQLQATIDKADALQQQGKECIRTRSTLEELHSFITEADNLPVTLPEYKKILDLIRSAEQWQKKCRAAQPESGPLKDLRLLLHSGERLGVEMPEVEDLRAAIRRREWEETARRALQQKVSLNSLREVVQDAEKMGAEETVLFQELEAKVEAAQAWDERAVELLKQMHQPVNQRSSTSREASPHVATSSIAVTPLPALESLQLLVADGQKLGVRMERLQQSQQLLTNATKWSQTAADLLSKVQKGANPAMSEVQAVISQGLNLHLSMPQLTQLQQVVQRTLSWSQQARILLARPNISELSLELQKMIAQAANLGIQPPELSQLHARIHAVEWEAYVQRVFSLLLQQRGLSKNAAGDASSSASVNRDTASALSVQASADDQLQAQGTGSLAATAGGLQRHSSENFANGNTAAKLVQKPLLKEAVTAVDKGAHLPVNTAIFKALQDAVENGKAYEAKVNTLIAAGTSSGADYRDVTFQEVQSVLEEGLAAPLHLAGTAKLQDVLLAHVEWENKAQLILKGIGQKPNLDTVQTLQKQALDNPIYSKLLDELQDVVVRAEDWLEKLRKMLTKKNSVVTLKVDKAVEALSSSVCQAQKSLKMMEVEEAARQRVEDEKGDGPPSKKQRTLEVQEDDKDKLFCVCLQPYHVDNCMLQCDSCSQWYHNRCVGVSVAQAKNLKKWSCPVCLTTGVKPDLEPLEACCHKFRKTRRPSKAELVELLGDGQQLEVSLKEVQEVASAVQGYTEWETKVTRILRKHETFRKHEAARAAKVDAANKPQPALGSSTVAASDKPDAARPHPQPAKADGAALAPVEAPIASSPAVGAVIKSNTPALATEGLDTELQDAVQDEGELVPLSDTMLRAVIKQACVVEVDASDVQGTALRLLKVEAWRARALQVLGGVNKPSIEGLNRLLREAEPLGAEPKSDSVAYQLSTLIGHGRIWQERTRELLEVLQEAAKKSDQPDEQAKIRAEARQHLTLGRQLSLKLDKDVNKLCEATHLYCLCETLYDENRPMLACDHCEDWFHYECVGMIEPREDGEAAQQEVAEFRCPRCYAKERRPYPHQPRLPSQIASKMDALRQQVEQEHAKRMLHRQNNAANQHLPPVADAGAVGPSLAGAPPAAAAANSALAAAGAYANAYAGYAAMAQYGAGAGPMNAYLTATKSATAVPSVLQKPVSSTLPAVAQYNRGMLANPALQGVVSQLMRTPSGGPPTAAMTSAAALPATATAQQPSATVAAAPASAATAGRIAGQPAAPSTGQPALVVQQLQAYEEMERVAKESKERLMQYLSNPYLPSHDLTAALAVSSSVSAAPSAGGAYGYATHPMYASVAPYAAALGLYPSAYARYLTGLTAPASATDPAAAAGSPATAATVQAPVELASAVAAASQPSTSPTESQSQQLPHVPTAVPAGPVAPVSNATTSTAAPVSSAFTPAPEPAAMASAQPGMVSAAAPLESHHAAQVVTARSHNSSAGAAPSASTHQAAEQAAAASELAAAAGAALPTASAAAPASASTGSTGVLLQYQQYITQYLQYNYPTMTSQQISALVPHYTAYFATQLQATSATAQPDAATVPQPATVALAQPPSLQQPQQSILQTSAQAAPQVAAKAAEQAAPAAATVQLPAAASTLSPVPAVAPGVPLQAPASEPSAVLQAAPIAQQVPALAESQRAATAATAASAAAGTAALTQLQSATVVGQPPILPPLSSASASQLTSQPQAPGVLATAPAAPSVQQPQVNQQASERQPSPVAPEQVAQLAAHVQAAAAVAGSHAALKAPSTLTPVAALPAEQVLQHGDNGMQFIDWHKQ